MIGRLGAGAIGVAACAWGGWLIIDRIDAERWPNLGLWLAGGVVAHDFVLAPLVLLGALLARRWMPEWLRGPIVAGAIVLGTLTIVAIPVLGGWGRRADNPSLLDRDYVAGWLVVASLVVLTVTVASVVRWRRMPRR